MSDGAESPSVTTQLGASGACPAIKHGEKTWKVGHPTQRAKATLETLAVQTAVAEVRGLKESLPPEAYAELFGRLTGKIAARVYKTWGDGWQEVVWGPLGAHLFLLSLLRENHPDATEADAQELAGAEPEQTTAALIQVIPSFIALLLSDRKDVTPQQREKILGVARELVAKMGPTPTPPAPSPETTVSSSGNGTKRSNKSRGASTLIKSQP